VVWIDAIDISIIYFDDDDDDNDEEEVGR